MQNQGSVKYTAILPTNCIEALKFMAQQKRIPSVNQGIRQAVEEYVAAQKKALYAQEMLSAARDEDFMQRTLDMQEAFSAVDSEEMGAW